MAEHSAVNRRVVSSSLTWGATQERPVWVFFVWLISKNRLLTLVNSRRLLTVTEPTAAGAGGGRRRKGETGSVGMRGSLAPKATMLSPGTGVVSASLTWGATSERVTLVPIFIEIKIGHTLHSSSLPQKSPAALRDKKHSRVPRLGFLPFACLPLFRGLRLRRRGTKKDPYGSFLCGS